MEEDFDEAVNDNIEQAQALLDNAMPIPSFEDIEEKINEIEIPQIDFIQISDLTSLCLYCEDLLNKRTEISNHTLLVNIYRNFEKEVEKIKIFIRQFENNSDKYLTSRQCMKYARQLNYLLTQFENELKQSE